MPITLNFDSTDFLFDYESDPVTERGYNPPGTTTFVRGLLNASLTPTPSLPKD
jgi:hypothetical protein